MDLTIQAVSGLIAATGFPEGPPVKAGPAVVDFISGIHLYAATLTALFERERTGRGRLVEVAMQEAAYATLTSQLHAYFETGEVPPRTGASGMRSRLAIAKISILPSVEVQAEIAASVSAMLRTRSALVRKRGSSRNSSRPIAFNRLCQCASTATLSAT